MENNLKSDTPDISGVPKEIQESIISDLEEKKSDASSPLWKVGISVSENEDLGALGYSNVHLRDLTIEIARHLLINNYILVYGGDLRREGFTEMFSDLAYQYRSIGNLKTFYFENYFAYPIYCSLTRQNELELKKNKTYIKKVLPPQELGADANTYLPPSTNENKLVWAKSLSHMRNQMIAGTNGRILIGGKCNNYLGKLPGIIEEAKITLLQNKPLYLIGAFGGAAKQVINAVLGQGFSFTDSNFHRSEQYQEFKSFYNGKSEEEINFEEDQLLFSKYGIDRLAENNGLTVHENIRLFDSPHLSEIVYYLFKGLNKILR
jgi:SLOG-like protein